jgi:nickel/cobalt exporter
MSRRLISFWVILAAALPAGAHPVPRNTHDRTITVRLTRDAVIVDYRLEVDEFTVVYVDLPAVSDRVDLTKLKRPNEFYEAFTQVYGPILADNLLATADDRPLKFICTHSNHEVLDHLRCDFRFEARWQPDSSQPRKFTFREANYELQTGMIRLSLASDPSVAILEKVEPDDALKMRAAIDLGPGDEERLRRASATFQLTGERSISPAESAEQAKQPKNSLLQLIDSGYGVGILLLLAAGFGAAHALTPGHGKTLVAAYLVGERGTVGHALVLGLVTTLTHTGVVILVAVALLWFFPDAAPPYVQTALGLGGGLLIAGTGLWLLLRRLSGGADHVHIGGHGNHHHHHGEEHADHHHDEHGQAHPIPAAGERVGWGSLIMLGMSGGIVPCWDAIAMLGFAVFAKQLWLGVPLLLAFSAGLAAVLVLIGILVVYVKGFADSRMGESRLVRSLPLVSAVSITLLGLWLCYESVPGW